MKLYIDRFYGFLGRPLIRRARVILALLVVPLGLSVFHPLWQIEMEAPQYPAGLQLEIYAYKIEGGDHGRHLQEINTLNHYIGMHSLDREALSDLDWIPFALGALLIFTLRVAAIGTVSSLVDLVVATAYVSLFAFGRFVYTLYVFGHNLSPTAPVKVPGFMPAILGSKQIANFTTHSFPALGSLLLAVFALGITAVLGWHLVRGRQRAVREDHSARPHRAPRQSLSEAHG